MAYSYVVTGGGRGIGRAVVQRLLAQDGAFVVPMELEPQALAWTGTHPAADRIRPVAGDAADPEVAERAADEAERAAPLGGWVNNAARFQDASVHTSTAAQVLDLVTMNLAPALVGGTAAIRRFLAAGNGGAVVNVSSHQARQAVPGSTPYVTAKAAIEGLTRALAVEYGRHGIRVNAVAPGSVETERYAVYLESLGPERAAEVEAEMARLHPLGRVATADEVATAITYLLSPGAAFVSGVTLPVDGGRSVLAHDPESR